MYIGLDLGTSGLKATLTDEGGAVLGGAEAGYDNPHPKRGWSEQDPAHWIAACKTVMDALRAERPSEMAALRGIGLSGQMHGATLLGADHGVLRPCMLWNDTRAAAQAATLDAAPGVREAVGNIVFPGFTAPKLKWVRDEEPEVFAATRLVLLPKDYLRLWLTGEAISDMSDAAGTAWLDVGARAWSQTALEAGGMTRDQMPALVEGSREGGRLRPALRDRWGIAQDVTVAGGGGDNAAAACGAGCLAEGQGFVSLGTSGVLLAARDGFAPDPETAVHTFCHALPGRWYQMGVILAATDCLNWLARQTGQPAAALAGALPERADGPGALTFLPYLSGERTPHNDTALRGAFVGLDVAHGPEDLTRAVVEGVSFALRDCLAALEGTGASLGSVVAMGGGARSAFWLETLASVLNLPLEVPGGGEFGAALGAARLARLAVTGEAPGDVITPPAIGRVVEPVAGSVDAYGEAWHRYRSLAGAVKAHMAG